jgi:hypothetical protein
LKGFLQKAAGFPCDHSLLLILGLGVPIFGFFPESIATVRFIVSSANNQLAMLMV